MKILAIIPARLGSSRFPGKPLAALLNRPMIEHVYQRTKMCRLIDEVYIATCDEEIATAAKRFGAKALMTSSEHQRASDRTAEAVRDLEADIVVMVQGDEPMIRPEMIKCAIEPLVKESSVLCTNLVTPIRSEKEFDDPNTVKVVMSRNGNALYYSREAIPSRKRLPFRTLSIHKQLGIILFRRDFLLRFAELPPTPLEEAESVDMLRVLEHGFSVRLVRADTPIHAVDTPEDLREVSRLMENDPLLSKYDDMQVKR